MKRLFITFTASLACVGAFGQGTLSFDSNDGSHLIYLTTDTSKLVPADRTTTVDDTEICGGIIPLAGSSLYTGLTLSATPGTIMSLFDSPTIIAALYGGTSSNSLGLLATTTIDDLYYHGNPGGVVARNLVLPIGFPVGTSAWFQVQVFDSRAGPNAWGGGAADAWTHANWYAGVSQIFQATPSTNYAPIWLPTSPVNSTWAAGTFAPVDLACIEGYYGAIEVYGSVPEVPPPGPGSLQVMISPSAAISAGAAWRLDPGTWPDSGWHLSGQIVHGLWEGGHTVVFKTLPGWCTPPNQWVLVNGSHVTNTTTGTYVAPKINVTTLQVQTDGTFQFAFTNLPGRAFSAYGTTNPFLPFSNWTFLGAITDSPPGQFQFTDWQATNISQRFYRVRSP
jgi:hypothetical protein